jgi:hypothetical protein
MLGATGCMNNIEVVYPKIPFGAPILLLFIGKFV